MFPKVESIQDIFSRLLAFLLRESAALDSFRSLIQNTTSANTLTARSYYGTQSLVTQVVGCPDSFRTSSLRTDTISRR